MPLATSYHRFPPARAATICCRSRWEFTPSSFSPECLRHCSAEFLGRALAYTTFQWPKLEKVLDHDVPIHNNVPGQQNKESAVGRKNWCYIGAHASA